jgi:pyridoxal phosphate enzyme (YggS family)
LAALGASAAVIGVNLSRVYQRIATACERVGRDPEHVRICVAGKYVPVDAFEQLRLAGVNLIGENRLQDLVAKQDAFGDAFEWHFIGTIQSRKVPEIARRVSLIHSLCTESAAANLNSVDDPPPVLVQVNVSGEASKQGLAPGALDDFCTRLAARPAGLMTMPPATHDPETARPYFRRLAELAAERGLSELSMGTSQDFEVAVEEGATIVRLGSVLFEGGL